MTNSKSIIKGGLFLTLLCFIPGGFQVLCLLMLSFPGLRQQVAQSVEQFISNLEKGDSDNEPF